MQSESTLILDPVQQRDPTTGDLVNGYLLGELLGRGAQGAVYRATKGSNPKIYAIKIVSLQGQSESFIDRVIRECSITTRLRHPGIMAVHEADYWGTCLYIVMDLAVGRPGDGMQDGSLGWQLSCEIAQRVARALHSAFTSCRIIHRDIKPANIIIDLDRGVLRAVKVVDFGLGRTADETGSDLTMTGMILGTPFFMSPEQAQGERNLGFQTDLYALGATLFQFIAGRPPFPDGSPVEILMNHCRKEPPRLEQIRPDCPPEVAAVVRRCLAKRPELRYPSYPAFISDLDGAMGKSPFEASGFDVETPTNQTPTSRRYTHQVLALPPADSAVSAPKSTPVNERSSASEALGDLFRSKLNETSRIYHRKTGGETTTPTEGGSANTAPTTSTRFIVPKGPGPADKPPLGEEFLTDHLPPVVAEEPEPEREEAPKREPSLPAGLVIDVHFAITGPIGAGAMGEVYAVEDTMTKRALALKILLPEDMFKPGIVLRFQSEASALATVDHPAFPFFAGKGSINGRDYLMMERVAGTDLKSWLKTQGGHTTEAKALHIVLQLVQAMKRAYSICGMVHRDIKPANLMITDAEALTLRIIDFGVSTYINYGDFEDFSNREYRYIDDDSLGKSVGTPAYMSPEQCIGAPPSPTMDIYAIGCTFYQLITGRTPFKARNSGHMMMKHLHDPPPLFDNALQVTSGSAYLLARCLAKKSEERFRNYKQLEDAIKAAIYSMTTKIKRREPSDQYRSM